MNNSFNVRRFQQLGDAAFFFNSHKFKLSVCSGQLAEELDVERKKAQAEKRPPRYNGKCRNLDTAEVEKRRAAGEEAAIRFKVQAGPAIA